MQLTGSYCALVTPMTVDGAIDYASLGGLIEWHSAAGTRGLVIAGTTGESASLGATEHADLIAAAVRFSARRLPIIAGAGAASTDASLRLARAAKENGAHGLLVVTPYYYRPTQEGLYRHYVSIADSVDLPLVLYNVPGRTGVDLLPETVARLAGHPNVVAFKEAVPDVDRIQALLDKAPDIALLSGDDGSARRSMGLGAEGVISVVANVAPAQIAKLCEHCSKGRDSQADELDAALRPLYQSLFIEPNPTPVKWALAHLGKIENGIRLPLLPLSEAAQESVAKDLSALADRTTVA